VREFFLRYWLEVVFGVITAAMAAGWKCLSNKIKKQNNDQKALKDGTQALLRNAIIQQHEKYIERGEIPIYGLENVLSMYGAYHALDGNGTITKIVEELKKLPSGKKEVGI
jgi:hypothetical protein